MSLSVRCHLKRPWFKMSFQRPHLQGQRGQRHGHGSSTHVGVNSNNDSDQTPSGWEPNPHPKKHIYQLCDYCYWHFFSTNSHSKASLSLFVQSEENQLRPPEQQGATVAGKKARADQDHRGGAHLLGALSTIRPRWSSSKTLTAAVQFSLQFHCG